jgi:transposase
MMGPERQGEERLFYYGFSLEKRIPARHLLRRIDELLDLGFVRRRVGGSYGVKGNVSEDPIVIIKLMFLLFLEGVKSERELMRTLPMRLDWLWFLGMGLDSEIPDHSVLSKARRRWGPEVFEELFIEVVSLCVKAGLVGGDKIHMDGSLVDADASRDSVRKAGVKRAYRKTEEKLTELEVEPPPRKWVSPTDPEASVVGRRGKKASRSRYKNHRAVDDAQGVITAVKTTPGHVSEPHEVEALIDQHEHHTGEKVRTVVGDDQYGTNENYRVCGKRQIRCHLGDVKTSRSSSEPELFTLEAFDYEAESDQYRCPAGKVRVRLNRKQAVEEGFAQYKIGAGVCPECELKPQCTKDKRGRELRVPLELELVEQGRREALSRAAYQDRRRRKHLMEGSFADATQCHHFKRARWRGLEKQSIQDYLIAVCQNLRILCSRGWYLKTHEDAAAASLPRVEFFGPHSIRTAFFAPFTELFRPPKGYGLAPGSSTT